MSPLSRRTALHAAGLAVVSTAGCVGDPPADAADETNDGTPTADGGPTLAPGETYETDDGRTLRVGEPAVHPSVVTVEYVSSTHYYERVADAGSAQYLAFVVEAEGFDLETEKRELYDRPIDVPLAVEVDGERYADPVPVGRDGHAYWDRIAVRVPVVDASDAAIRWERDDGPSPEWQLGPSTIEHLASFAEFEVRSWSAPDRVERGESFDASFTVANVGDRDGRFLTTFGVQQGSLPVGEVATRVPVGEERTHTATFEPYYDDRIRSIRVVLDWGIDRRTRDVEVTRSETGTGTPAE